MTQVKESIEVACPPLDAFECVRTHFYERNGFAPSSTPVTLKVPVRELTVDRQVSVSLSTHQAAGARRTFSISWDPNGGPYPKFDGTLDFAAAGDGCAIVLEGAYDPPLSFAGKAFDAAVGRRIATASIRAFLDMLGETIRQNYDRHLLASHDYDPDRFNAPNDPK
jgi:hypothetical protein